MKISIGDWTLDINPVTLEDDARFQCQIGAAEAGIAPIRSRYATLSVLVPPNPPKMLGGSGQMADGQTIHKTVEGRQVELRCESRGGKPAAEVRNGFRKNKKIGFCVPISHIQVIFQFGTKTYAINWHIYVL